jgi:hypothetical protein
MAHARCMLDTYSTHSGYEVLIILPLQQWLQERALLLRYTCIACLVFMIFLTVYLRN